MRGHDGPLLFSSMKTDRCGRVQGKDPKQDPNEAIRRRAGPTNLMEIKETKM